MTRDAAHRMRGSDRAMIAIGSVLLVLVVVGVILGAIAGDSLEYKNGRYVEVSGSDLNSIDVVFLVVGGLLVLIGAIRHALDRR